MRSVFLLAAVSAVALSAPKNHAKDKFDEFTKKHGIKCDGDACQKEYGNFEKRLANLEELQAKKEASGKTHNLGMTKFMTWSDEEMSAILSHSPIPIPHVQQMEEIPRKKRQTVAKDWRSTTNAVSPVRDQGQCGSCWAFATIAAVETQWTALGHSARNFSEQHLVDCDTSNGGCGGGWYGDSGALGFLANHGCALRSDYQYFSGTTGTEGVCKSVATQPVVSTTTTSYWASTVSSMEHAVSGYGPLIIYIDVPKEFFYYTGGVFDPDQTSCDSVNSVGGHAMAVVGYGTDPVGGDYWIVRNSWGSDWGESGYIRMKKNINNCNIEAAAILPLLNGQKQI